MGASISFPGLFSTANIRNPNERGSEPVENSLNLLSGTGTYFGPQFIFNNLGTLPIANATSRTYFDEGIIR
jgi:hypothetical protein